ncbi:MAG: VanZ family protein [Terracidiphilus sp.]
MSNNCRGATAVEPIARPGPAAGRRQGRRGVGYWISAWLPVLIGVCVIVLESTPMFGADHTSGPLRRIFQALFGPVGDARWDLIHHYIRKTGHFIGYGLIGLAWLRAWRMSWPRTRFRFKAGLALLGTVLVASWDEWHQTFLPNRTGSPWDVLLDCCGALTMLLIAYMFVRLFWPAQLKRA